MSDLLVGASITFVSMFVGWSVGRADRVSEKSRSMEQREPIDRRPPDSRSIGVSKPVRPKPPELIRRD